jgi:Cytidylyltransferase-like
MKNLFEITKRKGAVFAFGRMNPPTTGHEKLVHKVLEVAGSLGWTPFVFVTHTQDPKKNPLTSKQKVKYLKLGIPDADHAFVYNTSVKTIFDAIEFLSKKGYGDVKLVVGSDRVDEMKKLLSKYMNHPDPKLKLNLDSFEIVKAGDRDPDAEGVTGMSGTKMREAAQNNDFEKFFTGVPSKLSKKFAKEMFDAVRSAMHIREMIESVQKVSNTLNISRRDMPQIKRSDIPDFINSLKQKGIGVSNKNLSVSSLRPTQNEINTDRVKDKYDKMVNGMVFDPKPFIVSKDNYILDGHHQLFALKSYDDSKKVPCYVINVNMIDLLKHANSFPKTTYKTVLDLS